ncbi:RINT1_TIP1 domain-containing protein [Cephalotus follicularis]|uniref:RINT1_TIP1 domain-containing protein n=1 Tax=Cephalotus follicularis TaxID=3775 RepID=A0A1Q3BGN2_CEPFO|nr:RINT1_TIP1 domain-containing protein [Cephalotus follicularis]
MEQSLPGGGRDDLVLPQHSDLSPQQKAFLNGKFRTQKDLVYGAPLHIFATIYHNYSHSDADLINLQRALLKRAVSWISASFRAKTTLSNLTLNLHTLCLDTFLSRYGIGSKKTHQVLGEELTKLVKELKRIEKIRNYLDSTLQLEALVGDLEDAVFSATLSNVPVSTDSGPKEQRLLQAINAMNGIEEVLVGVAKFQSQWHHLLDAVDMRVDQCLAILRPQIRADHRALLASLGWPPKLSMSNKESEDISSLPNPLLLMQGARKKCYSESFLALCALQHLQTQREERRLTLLGQKKYDIQLWAIDELVYPIASRMEYHFLKWVDQPELIFTLVYKVTRDFVVGVDDVLQPLIDRARLVSYSATEAWVCAMVQMLSGFLANRVFSSLAENYKEKLMKSEVISSWLHLIDLIVVFDKRMQSLLISETNFFLVESGRFEGLMRGITVLMIFSDRPDWLKIWAKIELKDGWKKLKAELQEERAWVIGGKCVVDFSIGTEPEQFLLSSIEDYKAPLIAKSALEIAWEMIERCRSLSAILPRIQFIRSTAARFLWHFFKVLILRCKNEFSYDYPDNDSLVRVCGSINSARYVEFKLQEWSDDVTFLEMRVAETDSGMCRKDVAIDDDGFFHGEIKSLTEFETDWLIEIIAVLLRQFESLSWKYVQGNKPFEQEQEYLTEHGVSIVMDLAVSIDFVEALDTMRSQLHVLKMNLNSKDFSDLWRSVADGLDHFISCSMFSSNIELVDKGINQFVADMQALLLVFQPFCARPEAFFPCIREILKLFKMSKEEVKYLQWHVVDENGIKCLPSSGISHLSFHQVDKILRNRKFRV